MTTSIRVCIVVNEPLLVDIHTGAYCALAIKNQEQGLKDEAGAVGSCFAMFLYVDGQNDSCIWHN